MDKSQSVLPLHLQQSEHLWWLEQTIAAYFESMDLSKGFVFLIDSVSPNALPHLAEIFDVLGYRGWRQAQNDQDRRNVIKGAYELKKYMGTVYAIKQAMILTGYGTATLVEGVNTGDPQTDWARFLVQIDIGDGVLIDGNTSPQDLTNLINEYKNARSKLHAISFRYPPTDTISVIDDSNVTTLPITTPSDNVSMPGFKYNGTKKHDGSMKHRSPSEDVQITIIP